MDMIIKDIKDAVTVVAMEVLIKYNHLQATVD